MELGIKGMQTLIVDATMTASQMGSGTLEVFATPAMIALIEETAWRSVVPYLDEGLTTVGTLLSIEHVAPTPVGMQVRCETELIQIENRRLVFKACVYDNCGLIGKGTHERFIVKQDSFQKKAEAKRDANQ